MKSFVFGNFSGACGQQLSVGRCSWGRLSMGGSVRLDLRSGARDGLHDATKPRCLGAGAFFVPLASVAAPQ